ncbi:MAG: hypothetical protein HC771_12790 [Synechococcales cyanobacterium CRU_2_2]|nr:hypothetical protein [Synechococcales cyanobacterium CRU_2_2]
MPKLDPDKARLSAGGDGFRQAPNERPMPPEGDNRKRDVDEQADGNNDNRRDPVLCPHCLRTAVNGIQCKGICVADNGY